MDWLIRFFREQPLLLLVAVAWIAGIVGNVAKAAKKARERAEERTRGGRMPGPEPAIDTAPTADSRLPDTAAESIEREMERLLRGEAGDAGAAPTPARNRTRPDEVPTTEPSPPPLPRRPLPIRRDVPEVERPPVPVVPTTGGPRLPRHVDPHVGESIPNRASVGGRVGEHVLGHELGSLGGRVYDGPRRRVAKSRYALEDLKRVIVLNEILGPPLALRGPLDRGA
jgi:hypothetical protein